MAAADSAAMQQAQSDGRRPLAHAPTATGQLGHARLFYLDASGLTGLYASQRRWAEGLVAQLPGHVDAPRIALGFHAEALRLLVGTLAAGTVHACDDVEQERRAVEGLPLEALGLPPSATAVARALKLTRLGELNAVAAAEVHARLGAPLAQLLQRLRRAPPKPRYSKVPTPCVSHWHSEEPVRDACQLLFVGKSLLEAIFAQARARQSCVAALVWVLHFAPPQLRGPRPPRLRRVLRAARPNNEAKLWTDLLRLWLDGLQLPWAVEKLTVGAELAASSWVQAPLWPEARSRETKAAHVALARVRALFGEAAVTQAYLREHYLPEACFGWRPLPPEASLLLQARPPTWRSRTLVGADPLGLGRWPRLRRLYAQPKPLQPIWVRRLQQLQRADPLAFWRQQAHDDVPAADNVHRSLAGFCTDQVSYSYGWWETPQDRDYLYASFGPQNDGAVWWLYFCRHSRRWWWHGTVD